MKEKFTPEVILNVEDAIDDKISGTPIKSLEDDIERNLDSYAESVYPDAEQDLKDAKWYKYIYYFRWVFNFFVVGLPYFTVSTLMVVINLLLNVLFNKIWGGGNFLLIFNSFYLVIQTVFSWPLMLEIPFYLSHMRFFRLLSVLAALIYTAVYGFVVADWMFQLYFEPENAYESYSLFDVLVNMFLAYNIIFHLHVIPVNFSIILKEILLELFPPLLF